MAKTWLRELLNQMAQVRRGDQEGRRPGRVGGRKGIVGRLAVEQLEDRCLLTTLQAISLPTPGQAPSDTAAGASVLPAVSADGNFVAFGSTANNLVPGQAGGVGSNVFLLDRGTGSVTLVSHLPGAPTTGSGVLLRNPSPPLLSRDGHYVVYVAGNDVDGRAEPDTFPTSVFVYDRTTGQNTLVSHTTASPTTPTADGARLDAISRDGNYIVFDSSDQNLVPNEQSSAGYDNLYLYDLATQTTSLITHAQGPANVAVGYFSSAPGGSVAVADDGTVVFEDEDLSGQLISADTGASGANVYLYTPATQANQLVSAVSGSATAAAGQCGKALISADGSTVVYVSSAAGLVPGLAGGRDNVFRYSVAAGTTTLVSGTGGSATTGGNGDSGALGFYTYGVGTYAVALTPDGRFIAFVSQATDLVSGQTGKPGNVFLYDAQSSTLTLLSGVEGSSTNGASGDVSLLPANASVLPTEDPISQRATTQTLSISDDASLVAFVSQANDLAPGETGPSGNDNVFLYSRATGQPTLATGVGGSARATDTGESGFPVLSGDGSLLAVHSVAADLVPGVFDANGVADVFTYGTAGKAVAVVSRAAFVQAATGNSYAVSASADGRYTLLTSTAEDLVPNQVTVNANQNVFLRDNLLGTVTLVNHLPGLPDTTGDGGIPFTFGQRPNQAQSPVISADGSTVAFVSTDDDLVAGEAAGTAQLAVPLLYLYDVQTGQVRLAGHGDGTPFDVPPYYDASQPSISATGRYVAYAVGGGEIDLYDGATDTTTVLANGLNGLGGTDPSISGDGRYVAYQYTADLIFTTNVYVYDSTGKTTTLVSHAAGSPTGAADADSTSPVISQDGGTIAFVSAATDLLSGQSSSGGAGLTNVFLYNVASGAVTLVSGMGGSAAVTGDGNSDSPVIDGDGSYVAYRSDADNLISGQVSGSNIYEYSTAAGTETLVSHRAGVATTSADGTSAGPVIDDDGHLISYVSTANDLVANQSGPVGFENVYLWLRQTDGNILASGQDGSPTVTANADSTGPVLTGAAVPSFSSTATDLLRGVGGSSIAYINTLVQLVLSATVVPAGSSPGSVVGTLSVESPLAGQLLLPTYRLPAGAYDNGAFALGTGAGGTAPLLIEVLAGAGGRPSYEVSVRFDAGLGNDFAQFEIAVGPTPPGGGGGSGAITARLVTVKVGRKKTTRRMVEVLDADTGAVEETFAAPFQGPAYSKGRVSVRGNQVVVTARKGRKTVSRTFFV
jgi:Tol biopolymer transport system component